MRNRSDTPKQREMLARTIYNFAKCKYEWGKIKNNSAAIESARKMIVDYQKQVAGKDGTAWDTKMDTLLRQINAATN